MNFYLDFYALAAGAAGMYLIMMSLSLYTHNMRSAIFFKVVPFFSGVAVLIAALKEIGVL